MRSPRPIASLSLDLDNQWSYMKTHGDPGWEDYPSYLDIVVPRVLAFLKERELTITFFVVGQDAALKKNHTAIQAIAEAGHEIGNHSFSHEPWLHLYSADQIENELRMAEEQIFQVTGYKPKGFRGPGYSLSAAVLNALARLGYLYDASTLPTFIGPLARTYYFMRSKFSAEEKQKRDLLFGSWQDGLRPVRPFRWQMEGSGASGEGLIEIPVTTMPVFKIPFHVSYLLYLAGFSPRLARIYLSFALWLCRQTGTQPSLLLHPLDFLGREDCPDLAFFPAMNMGHEQKVKTVGNFITMYQSLYQLITLLDHALLVSQTTPVLSIESKFSMSGKT